MLKKYSRIYYGEGAADIPCNSMYIHEKTGWGWLGDYRGINLL